MNWQSLTKGFNFVALIFKGILIAVLWVGIIGVGFLAGFFTEVIREMPMIEKLNVPNPAVTSRIYDATGKIQLGSLFSEENRIIVGYKTIPDDLKNAVIAVEDKGFYTHPGISPRGIVRAFIANVKGGKISQGASTITMQLVRNLYLSHDRTWRRKILEMLISLKLEQRFTKDEILTFYLNEVCFGRNTWGVEAASQSYFGKHVSDLNLGECALLAGLPQRPSAYAPRPDNMDAALERRETVLHAMLESGYISVDMYDRAVAQEIEVLPVQETSYKGLVHPYFTTYVIAEVQHRLGNRAFLADGLNIYTTIDTKMQTAAEEILPAKIAEYADQNVSQGALMTIDPKTGAILAMVGGVDFNESELNRAWQSPRQPGSSFKPLVFLRAIEKGYSPSSLIVDEEMEWFVGNQRYAPNNYDHDYRGVMTAQEALARSRNICAVKVIDIVGPGEVAALGERLGIRSHLNPYLSLGLGGSEVRMVEMCAAYATFANDGVYNAPFSIWKITDSTGKVLYEHQARPDKVIEENDVRLLNQMTQAVVSYGTGTRARITGYEIAGKTGTTSRYSDAWFIGYTPNLCTAVWMGNDKVVDFMKRVTGGVYPAVIWHDYMEIALEDYEVEKFPRGKPPGRTKPLDKERTSAELQLMLEQQEEYERMIEEGLIDEDEANTGPDGEFRHPWEIISPEDEEEDEQDPGDNGGFTPGEGGVFF